MRSNGHCITCRMHHYTTFCHLHIFMAINWWCVTSNQWISWFPHFVRWSVEHPGERGGTVEHGLWSKSMILHYYQSYRWKFPKWEVYRRTRLVHGWQSDPLTGRQAAGICLCVSLFVRLTVYLSICLLLCRSVNRSTDLFIDPSIHPSNDLSIYVAIYLPTIYLTSWY